MQTVLGINGITGKLLAEELIRRGYKVRGVSRRPFSGNWEHVSADILSPDSLNKAIKGSEVVYFCVGLEYNIKVWQRDWLPLIDSVIAVCLANKAKLVFLDNVYMYGLVSGEMTEQTPMNPTSKKGEIRKAMAEKPVPLIFMGLIVATVCSLPQALKIWLKANQLNFWAIPIKSIPILSPKT
jgi:nucleoside-diphosphate-sugar epimerase